MDDTARLALLHGPYVAPVLKRGTVVTCLYRDGDAVIVDWTDALIPWPRCRRKGSRSGVGPWVGAGLADAVRTESEIAVAHWWGVTIVAVRRWRRALGVGRITEGTHALYEGYAPEKCLRPDVQAAAKTPEVRRRVGEQLSAARKGRPVHANSTRAILDYNGVTAWTTGEDAVILATATVAETVTLLPHRSRAAIRIRRHRLGVT